jgi:hypothetical protein
MSEEELRRRLGLEDDFALSTHIRRTVFVEGDDALYREARRASDGFEDFDLIRSRAAGDVSRTAMLLRKAIVIASGVDPATAATVLSPPFDEPKEWWAYQRYLRGTLISDVETEGTPDDLAKPDKQYPMVEMKQIVKGYERTPDDRYDIDVDTTITPLLAEGVGLQANTFRVFGPKPDPPP